MRGLRPAVSQAGYQPQVLYHDRLRPMAGTQHRTVNPKPNISLAELIMEPLHYNPHMMGWWGASLTDPSEWELDDRLKAPKPQLIRSSDARDARCAEMYNVTKSFADAGFTHMAHLLTGWAPGETLEFHSYRTVRRKLGGTPGFSERDFNSLLEAVPAEWKLVIKSASVAKNANPSWDLEELARKLPPPVGSWVATPMDE